MHCTTMLLSIRSLNTYLLSNTQRYKVCCHLYDTSVVSCNIVVIHILLNFILEVSLSGM